MADPGAGEKLKVFISYSRKDSAEFADELVAGLEYGGFAPFLDRHDIAAGEDWEARLGGLIAQSDTVVFVVSPEAVKSDRCVWEVDRTIELSKRLLPVIFKPVPEHDLPKKLSRLQFVRFDTGRGITRPLAELAEALRQDLDWIREHTRLGELARRWEGRVRPESLLLRGDDLDAAKGWMAIRKVGAPEITDAQRALISASEEAEEKRLGNERAQLDREKAQLAEIKAAQARTARLQRITRRVIAAAAAVILIAGGIVGWLQWDKARRLATKEVALAESRQHLDEAQVSVSKEQASNAALNESLNRRQLELEHARVEISKAKDDLSVAQRANDLARINLLAEFATVELLRGRMLTSLRLAVHSARLSAGAQHLGRTVPAGKNALAATLSLSGWQLLLGDGQIGMQSAAFSHDGARIVARSRDGKLRIWDTLTGEQLAVLQGPAGRPGCTAFSADAARIVVPSGHTATVWDAANGHRITSLGDEYTGAVFSAAFSRDGAQVITGSWGGANVWDVATGNKIVFLNRFAGWVKSTAFSPDDSRIAAGARAGAAGIWNAKTGEEIVALRGHEGEVLSIAFSPDGGSVVTGSQDTTARIWEAGTGKQLAVLRGHEGRVTCVAFSSDGALVVTSSDDHSARIWDAIKGTELAVLRTEGEVTFVAFSPDGSSIFTGSADETARVWETFQSKKTHTLQGHTAPVTSVAFNPDGSRVGTASEDKTVRIWDAAAGEQLLLIEHPQAVESVAFSPDGSKIVTGSRDNTARVWDVTTGQELSVLRHEGWVRSAAFSPDGARIATTAWSPELTVRVWDAKSFQNLLILRHHVGTSRVGAYSVAFHPNGSQIVSAVADRVAIVSDTVTGNELARLPGHTNALHTAEFSRSGSRIITGSLDGTVLVWDATSAKPIFSINGSVAHFSPHGDQIAVLSPNGNIQIRDSDTGAEIGELTRRDNKSGRQRLAFSPDGTQIVASSGNAAEIWNVRFLTAPAGELVDKVCTKRLVA
jgi:WD40 repeat protein